jgi:hypothetical protein
MLRVLLAVAKLLQHSTNFKVRIAAAHAVSDIPTREVFGSGYEHILHALMVAVEGAAGPVEDFRDLKYQTALRNALRAALLQVVCSSLRSDYADSWQLLTDRAVWLFQWLCDEEAAASAAEAEAEVQRAEQGPGGEVVKQHCAQEAAAAASSGAQRVADSKAEAAAAAGLCASSSSVGAYVTPSGGVAFPRAIILKAYRQLTAMFESRVKTIPLALLQQYQARAFGNAA